MNRRLPVAWLVVIDLLVIAAGVGAFYLYLGVVPQPYEVVPAPARRGHSLSTAMAAAPDALTTALPSATPATGQHFIVTSAASRTSTATSAATMAAPAAAFTPTAIPSMRLTSTRAPTPTPQAASTALSPQTVPQAGAAGTGDELGNGKFADKFTGGNVEQTATTYRSSDINVTLTRVQRKGVTYYVQDIYVRYIDNLRTAFARKTYGRAISAWDLDIAKANDAIGAINGDWYGTGIIGAVIRNGVLYNARAEDRVFCPGTVQPIDGLSR